MGMMRCCMVEVVLTIIKNPEQPAFYRPAKVNLNGSLY